MILPRHDRVFHIESLTEFPGKDFLDRVIFLPLSNDIERRIWLLTPRGLPILGLDEMLFEPEQVFEGENRWIDYGIRSLPFLRETNWSGGYFAQLRLYDIPRAVCKDSYLVITNSLGNSFSDQSIVEAERTLWGIAREHAGSTRLKPEKCIAGDGVCFELEYRAGPLGLPKGGMIRFSVPYLFSMPQTESPDAPGYLLIQNEDVPVRVDQIAISIEAHEKVDIICSVLGDLAPGKGFNLRYQTEETQVYPCVFDEIDRVWWYSHLPPLAASAAVSPGSPFVSLAEENSHTFELIPGPVARLHLFLPGRLYPNDRMVLRGTFTDRYRNVPPDGSVDLDLDIWLVGDDERILLEPTVEHMVSDHRFEYQLNHLKPGIYRAFAYRRKCREEIARSNPLEVVSPESGLPRLYWGEIHSHTEMSDGCGKYTEMFRHAKEEGCLDFAGAADHAVNFSDNQWAWMQTITNARDEPGRFVALIGYEWGGKQMHRNVYTSRTSLDLIRGRMLLTSQVGDLWNHFHGDEEVVGGGHASLGHGMTWEMHDPTVERFIEIYSMWGASDFLDSPLSPAASPMAEGWNWERPGIITVNEILRQGAKLGFTGGGDCHDGRAGFSSEMPGCQGLRPHTAARAVIFHCGMTAALMDALDRKSLIAALRNRKTYATTGPRILLDFSISGLEMGMIGTADEVVCQSDIRAVNELKAVEIIKDGVVTHQLMSDDLDLSFYWTDPEVTSGEHYYYLHVIQEDGEEAWSSPIWIQTGGFGDVK